MLNEGHTGHTHSDSCNHDIIKSSAKETLHIPSRKILTKEDLERFQTSECYSKFMGFIERLNSEILDKPLTKIRNEYLNGSLVNGNISGMCRLLAEFSSWIDEIPAHEIGLSRFGNPGFRDWYDRVQERLDDSLHPFLESKVQREEAGVYLLASFGDRKRIDYGTGHEANFICFLLCCVEFRVFSMDAGLVAAVFWDYIKLMRKLQFVYWLEPAGSHGVWGLDDYQFLPFLFGSGQLANHKHLRPKSIHDSEMVDELEKDYMYFSCIRHINSIKSASLRWHSPMLDDISGVKRWSKVNEGMFKMYRQEVLNKLPIMQHFLFGSVLFLEGNADVESITAQMEHVHAFGQERPLCCVIRVPSSIAAASQDQKRIPFD